ncbi:MAG: hypothetical protein RIF41_04045 [Polyangiaceae bacterium]
MVVRPDGRFVAWGAACLGDWLYRGSWKFVSEETCIVLDEDPFVCAPGDDSLCCVDPDNCRDRYHARICRDGNGDLVEQHGRFWSTYRVVDGHPADVPGAHDGELLAYKVETSCTRHDGDVGCWCATNAELAGLPRADLGTSLSVVAAEPLDLGSLVDHELVELNLIDPSLTSLARLPESDTLRVLTVQAPVRELGDMRRFPSLEKLVLRRTHLTDLTPLRAVSLRDLHVTSLHALELAPLATMTSLETLLVRAMDIASVEAVNGLRDLTTLGLASAPKWPTPSLDLSLTGIKSPSITTLVLQVRSLQELESLVDASITERLPKLSTLKVLGAAHITTGSASGPGLVEPNDYVPPDGVSLKPGPSSFRFNDGSLGSADAAERCMMLELAPMDRCGWSQECAERGHCTVSADGRCHAANDGDCKQSIACFDEGRCKARAGACFRGGS